MPKANRLNIIKVSERNGETKEKRRIRRRSEPIGNRGEKAFLECSVIRCMV